jgi:hypothetical protein
MEILREQGRLTVCSLYIYTCYILKEKRRCVQIELSPTKRKSPINGGEYESFRDVLSVCMYIL